MRVIAAQGPVTAQAQADTLTLAAKHDLKLISVNANANLDFAAAKRIELRVEGGASLVIENGSITLACPGTLSVKAGMKEMTGGASTNYALPKFPQSRFELERPLKHFDLRLYGSAGATAHPLANAPWKITHERPSAYLGLDSVDESCLIAAGITDADGRVILTAAQEAAMLEEGPPLTLVSRGQCRAVSVTAEDSRWNDEERLLRNLKAQDFTSEDYTHVRDRDAAQRTEAARAALAVAQRADVSTKLKPS